MGKVLISGTWPARPGGPAKADASRWQTLVARVRGAIGHAMTRLGVGGLVHDLDYTDKVTGRHLEIRVGDMFTRISVDGRDYYFRRLTGKFDGTGTNCT